MTPEPVDTPAPNLVVTPTRRVGAVLAAIVPGLPLGAGLVVLGRFGRALFWLVATTLAFAAAVFAPVPALVAVWVIGIGAFIDSLTAKPPAAGIPDLRRFLLVFIGFVLLGIALRGVVNERVVRPFGAATAAMEPALLEREAFMGDLRGHAPQRGEIWAFDGQQLDAKPADTVQRVVAVAGDTVAFRGGLLHLNGKPVASADARCASGDAACVARIEQHGSQRVQVEYRAGLDCVANLPNDACPANLERVEEGCRVREGYVFALGDNRCVADDSRRYGAVPVTALVGRAIQVYFSPKPGGGLRFDRIGTRL